jgi:hypothetical protein
LRSGALARRPRGQVEQGSLDGGSDGLMPSIVRMQVIPAVELRTQAPRCGRVAQGGIEVDDRVEAAPLPYPGVDLLALRLDRGSFDGLAHAPYREKRCSEHRHLALVRGGRQPPHPVDYLRRRHVVDRSVEARSRQYVVYAFEQHHPAHSGLSKNVPREARERARPDEWRRTVVQDAVAADGRIAHRHPRE